MSRIHIPIGRGVRDIIEGYLGHAVVVAGIIAGLILFAFTLHACVPAANAAEGGPLPNSGYVVYSGWPYTTDLIVDNPTSEAITLPITDCHVSVPGWPVKDFTVSAGQRRVFKNWDHNLCTQGPSLYQFTTNAVVSTRLRLWDNGKVTASYVVPMLTNQLNQFGDFSIVPVGLSDADDASYVIVFNLGSVPTTVRVSWSDGSEQFPAAPGLTFYAIKAMFIQSPLRIEQPVPQVYPYNGPAPIRGFVAVGAGTQYIEPF